MATPPALLEQDEIQQLPPAKASANAEAKARFLPLDAYRGLIMILLVSDGFGFAQLPNHGIYGFIAGQFRRP